MNTEMKEIGTFTGIGVGPGPAEYLTVAACKALQQADIIYIPRARHIEHSVAEQCIAGLEIPRERLRDTTFNMDSDRTAIGETYNKLAENIAIELRKGQNVAYVTIGDSLTYSTYNYTLSAILKILPDLKRCTFAGITSFAAASAALEWPLGQGKERTLILPCPDDMNDLKKDIQTHDIVVLMKIGHRLLSVLDVIDQMGIASHCALASRIGLPGEVLHRSLHELEKSSELGYLTTMLIRKTAPEERYASPKAPADTVESSNRVVSAEVKA